MGASMMFFQRVLFLLLIPLSSMAIERIEQNQNNVAGGNGGMISTPGRCPYGSLWCNNTALTEYVNKSCGTATTEGYPSTWPQLFALKRTHTRIVRIESLPFNFILPPNLAGGNPATGSRCYSNPVAKSVGAPLRSLASEYFSSGTLDRKNINFGSATGFVIMDPITTIPGDYRISYDAWEVHEAPNCNYVSGARGITKTVLYGDTLTTYPTPTPHPSQGSCSAIERRSKCLYMQGFDQSTYDYETCSEGCVLDGVQLRTGESATFYSSTTSYNCSADSQVRTCNNGTLSGSASYNRASCVQKVDCIGSWGACTGACGTGTQTFTITQNAQNGGNSCSTSNGATQSCPRTSRQRETPVRLVIEPLRVALWRLVLRQVELV